MGLLEANRRRAHDEMSQQKVLKRINEVREIYAMVQEFATEETEEGRLCLTLAQFEDNWSTCPALVHIFAFIGLQNEDIVHVCQVIDVHGNGLIDRDELAQFYLKLKAISRDPSWMALILTANTTRSRIFHLTRALEAFGFDVITRDVLQETLTNVKAQVRSGSAASESLTLPKLILGAVRR